MLVERTVRCDSLAPATDLPVLLHSKEEASPPSRRARTRQVSFRISFWFLYVVKTR